MSIIWDRYQIRYAAGIYWLLDMEQQGYPYEKPLPLNEMGAQIWEMMQKGLCLDEISKVLGKEYGISDEEIREDIRVFCGQLRERGIQV